jgi:hypothetical protein
MLCIYNTHVVMPVGCVKTTLPEFRRGLMDDVAMWIREGLFKNFQAAFPYWWSCTSSWEEAIAPSERF